MNTRILKAVKFSFMAEYLYVKVSPYWASKFFSQKGHLRKLTNNLLNNIMFKKYARKDDQLLPRTHPSYI